MSLPFAVLFEDQHLLVLSKPAGLLSQGDSSKETSLVDLLRVYFKRNYVGLIQRLDRNTTGLMVVAKRSKSAERLTQQLMQGTLIRKYHAILFGTLLEGSNHTWEHWLVKNEATNEVKALRTHQAPKNFAHAKHAKLNVRAMKNFTFNDTPLTLAQFELETGRSHQIRAQCATMRHPIIGDKKYDGGQGLTASVKEKISHLFDRPALHSCYLAFEHPMTHAPLQFEEPYSEDIKSTFFAHLE